MSSRITVRCELPVVIPTLSVTTHLPLPFEMSDDWFFERVDAHEDYTSRVTALDIPGDVMRDFLRDNAQILLSSAFCEVDHLDDFLGSIATSGSNFSELDPSCFEIEY